MRSLARRLLCFALAALALASAAAPAQARGYGFLSFTAQPKYAAIVQDAKTGEVLYEQSADSQRYPASITKIMTMYLAFEAISTGKLSPNDMVVVSPHAAAQAPSKLGLRQGQSIQVVDAMSAIAVKSANDMAVALAEKLGGSESRFATMMTLKAQELGMKNSHFVNASGLPDSRQLTTARDIAILSRAVLRDYPQYYAYFGKREFLWHGQAIRNHNGLLGKMPGVDGIKTGFTNASGFNLAASAVRDNRRLIAVVMGGSSTAARDMHVQDLLEAGFSVLRRRDKGEVTTIAENMHEPIPSGSVDRAPVEQGDGEQEGVKIVVDGKAPAVKALAKADGSDAAPTTCAAAPRRKGRHARRHARCVQLAANKTKPGKASGDKSGAGPWQVQVGVYKDRSLARQKLALLNHKFAVQLDDAQGRVDHRSGRYSVRFAGLSADGAREACAAMRAKGQDCLAMGPRG